MKKVKDIEIRKTWTYEMFEEERAKQAVCKALSEIMGLQHLGNISNIVLDAFRTGLETVAEIQRNVENGCIHYDTGSWDRTYTKKELKVKLSDLNLSEGEIETIATQITTNLFIHYLV